MDEKVEFGKWKVELRCPAEQKDTITTSQTSIHAVNDRNSLILNARKVALWSPKN